MDSRASDLHLVLLLLVLGVLPASPRRLPAQTTVGQPQRTGGIAAVVGQEVITHGELNRRVDEYLSVQAKSMDSRALDSVRARLRLDFLELLIDQSLLLQEAKRQGIAVTEENLNYEINQGIRRLQKIRQEVRDADDFFNYILENEKITREAFLEKARREILVNKLLWGKVFKWKEFIPPGERREYYQVHKEEFQTPSEFTFRQIYLSPAESGEEILEIIDRGLDKGISFREMAEKFSESELKGEPWIRKWDEIRSWPAPLLEALKRMKPGDVERRIQTSRGWHYLKLESVKPGKTQPFEEVQEEIQARIRKQRMVDAQAKFLERLRERVVIKRFLREPDELEEDSGGEPATAKPPADQPAGEVQDVSPEPTVKKK